MKVNAIFPRVSFTGLYRNIFPGLGCVGTFRFLSLLAFALALFPQVLHGQNGQNPSTAIGQQPSVMQNSDTESINNANGGVSVSVPLLHLPGINGFDLNLSVRYDSKIPDIVMLTGGGPNEGTSAPGPEPPLVYSLVWSTDARALSSGNNSNFANGYLSIPMLSFNYTYRTSVLQAANDYPYWDNVYCVGNFVYHDETGAQHSFMNQPYCDPSDYYAVGLVVSSLLCKRSS